MQGPRAAHNAIHHARYHANTLETMPSQDTRNGGDETNRHNELTYARAGVDITAGNQLVERIKPLVRSTGRAGVLGGIGGFGGLFELPLDRYRAPVMVSGTDGVGTKLRLAIDLGRIDTVGIDLVAMCVNDILVCGAEPLWFLDYYATGKLDVDAAERVIAGIAEGCRQSGMALLGGETAEMPGMYEAEDFDLAGFAVGIVERDRIIDGQSIAAGDVVLGIGASGCHSNGYSLIRKVLERDDPARVLGDTTLGEALLAPTRIYVQAIRKLMDHVTIKGMAHITGGGLLENIPRCLPAGTTARLHVGSWQMPAVFEWLQDCGNIADAEMYRTFNCGIGMAVIVDASAADAALACLANAGDSAWRIGEIAAADAGTAPGVEMCA